MIDQMQKALQFLSQNSPLVHCITNPISMNDCANAVLAVGGKPIMAEHPEEVAEITALAQALVLNLGNISDARMESMLTAGEVAKANNIPCVLDLVGVACSSLRLGYAKKLVEEISPCVIKGNLSELRAFCGVQNHAKGIDAGEQDGLSAENQQNVIAFLSQLSKETRTTVVATGKTDIIIEGTHVALVHNGCEMLAQITGTGCMLGMLIGCFVAQGVSFHNVVNAVSYFGICGELAETGKGTGSFRVGLLDWLSVITVEQLSKHRKVEKLK